jgi:DNA-directed RNA polymerase subunit RPC12/RpoP
MRASMVALAIFLLLLSPASAQHPPGWVSCEFKWQDAGKPADYEKFMQDCVDNQEKTPAPNQADVGEFYANPRVIGLWVAGVIGLLLAVVIVRELEKWLGRRSSDPTSSLSATRKTAFQSIHEAQELETRGPSPLVYRSWGYVSGGKVYETDVASIVLGGLGTALRCLFGAVGVLFLVGVVFGRPLIGLIMMPLELWAGLLGHERRTYGTWSGKCPHCGEAVTVCAKRNEMKAFDCQICTKRVLLKDKIFRPV